MRGALLPIALISIPLVATFPRSIGSGAPGGPHLPDAPPACASGEMEPSAGEDLASERPAILDYLVGSWDGEGELFGLPADFAMEWVWELDGSFLGLSYEIRGNVQMSARAHYRIATGDTIQGVWVDSRGEILELRATTTDSALVTVWRSQTEQGRTVYQHSAADSLHVCDYVQDDTSWRHFGTAHYVRR